MDSMLQTAALVAAAYASPVLFGRGVYLVFAQKPQRAEAAAVSWGAGWAAVNLVTFTANQAFGARLDGTFYAVTAATLAAAGLGLVAYRRERLRTLLRLPLLPPDLRSGFGLAALVLLSGFLLLVLYKAIIVWPAAADALIYHMALPKEAFQSATLPFHAGVDMIDIASTYPDLLVTQQLWIYLGTAAFAALGAALLVVDLWSQRAKANHTPSRQWHVPLKRLLGFSMAGLVVTAVFLARNTVLLANPFYPYFFGGVDTQATAYYYEIFTPDVITQIWGFEAVALLSTVVIGCLLLGLFRVRAWTKIERLLFLSSVFYLPPYLYYPLPR